MTAPIFTQLFRMTGSGPARFEQVAQELRRRIPGVLAIHHVGSTAVPGPAGRNIIDVELVVDPSVPDAIGNRIDRGWIREIGTP